MTIKTLLTNTKIIPVITINALDKAVPLAEALLEGGLNALEITLRTPVAMEAIAKIHQALPECRLLAGTVTQEAQIAAAKAAGACAMVSPGNTPTLMTVAKNEGMDFLPGVMTPSDVLTALEHDLTALKFFPAGLAGGIKMLKNFQALFPTLQFCPTGGITIDNMQEYLSLDNVFCVGGSWLAPQHLIDANDWSSITKLAKTAQAQALLIAHPRQR